MSTRRIEQLAVGRLNTFPVPGATCLFVGLDKEAFSWHSPEIFLWVSGKHTDQNIKLNGIFWTASVVFLFVSSKLSYTDVTLWVALQLDFARMEGNRDQLPGAFPAVKKLVDGVLERERIKAYVARDVHSTKA
jgi:hypothetical protein